MKKTNTSKTFIYSSLYLSLFVLPMAPSFSYAEETVELKDVYVVGKKKATRKENDITGLGKIVKTKDTINKEQILSIRDLVRYDPGVSVVEQGRGGSAGYSMRGVDKNRVALVVDGIPQAQSYVMQGENTRSRQGGGSINEIENENITSVEISKGASSSEYGSGSLGGAIGFRTKEPSDILGEDEHFGGTAKTAYSSKNEQYTHSFGLAGRANRVEGLIQYTHKIGKSTKIHDDAINTVNYDITRLGGYRYDYDLREPNTKPSTYFVIEGECGSGASCEPRSISQLTNGAVPTEENLRNQANKHVPFSEEEKQFIPKTQHVKEHLNPKDYTGNARVIPDPMKYKTGSILSKIGVYVTKNHYIGGVFEETKQRYDIQDMSVSSYYSPYEAERFNTIKSSGVYSKSGSILDGIYIVLGQTLYEDENKGKVHGIKGIGLRWSRTQFFDERHTKTRKGLVYRFTGEKDSFLSNATLSYDNQKIILDSHIHNLYCSEYPTIDKNCRPSVDKPWSYYLSERNIYTEDHDLIKLSLDKTFKVFSTKHNAQLSGGVDFLQSRLDRKDYFEQYAIENYVIKEGSTGNGYFNNPYIYQLAPGGRRVMTETKCNNLSAFRDCNTRIIKGNNKFIALREHINVNKYLDIGLGGRIDSHRFVSDDPWTASKNYTTRSWNLGVVVKPTRNIALSYRVSNGFRVPSFQEMFGHRVPGFERGEDDEAYKVSNLRPEKSLNREVGIGFKGDFGSLEASYFINQYNDLITLAAERVYNEKVKRENIYIQYNNAQNIELKGINVVGKIDWNGIYDKLPEGLYTNLAYNKAKPTKIMNDPRFFWLRSYAFDTLQPSRYIASLGYDQPDDKWGINLTMTYSKAKKLSEVQSESISADGSAKRENITDRTTKSWYIYDLVGHIKPHKNITVRAGIYNLMNYRYITWESVRQSAVGSINRHHDVSNYARYAAPGRNFVLSLEAKF